MIKLLHKLPRKNSEGKTIRSVTWDLKNLDNTVTDTDITLYYEVVCNGIYIKREKTIPIINNSIRYLYIVIPVGRMELREFKPNPYGHGPGLGTTQEIFVGTLLINASGKIALTMTGYFSNSVTHNFENINLDPSVPATKFLKEYDSDFSTMLEKVFIKSEFGTTIDPMDSLSYLETQVDLLSELLLELVPKEHPKYHFLQEFCNNSILSHLPTDQDIIKRIREKYLFRLKQLDYLDKIAKLTNPQQ